MLVPGHKRTPQQLQETLQSLSSVNSSVQRNSTELARAKTFKCFISNISLVHYK